MKKVLLGLIACQLVCQIATASSDFPGTLNQEEYRKLYPLSVKFCPMTKVHRKGEGAGGAFAHAVLYFDNACVETSHGYPQIRRCRPGETQGTGVSVNKVFKNVNWVAVPTRETFFYGDLPNNEMLDMAAKGGTEVVNTDITDVSAKSDSEERKEVTSQRLDLISKIAALGIYQGIELKDNVAAKRKANEDETRFKINQSLDTDFAINWGRDVYCVNVPLNENLLDKGIEFVNLANIVHADKQRLKDYKLQYLNYRDLKGINIYKKDAQPTENASEYNWNGISENCAHLAYNLFAAMGLVSPRRVGIKIPNPFTMAVPADRWVSLIRTANSDFGRAIDEVWDLYLPGRNRNILLEQKVVVKHNGVIAEAIPTHNVEKNDIFIRSEKLVAMWPMNWWPTYKYSVKRPKDLYDVGENLVSFDARYTRQLEELKGPVLTVTPERFKLLQSASNMKRFIETVEAYKDAIRTAQKQVRAKLEILASKNADEAAAIPVSVVLPADSL